MSSQTFLRIPDCGTRKFWGFYISQFTTITECHIQTCIWISDRPEIIRRFPFHSGRICKKIRTRMFEQTLPWSAVLNFKHGRLDKRRVKWRLAQFLKTRGIALQMALLVFSYTSNKDTGKMFGQKWISRVFLYLFLPAYVFLRNRLWPSLLRFSWKLLG